MIIEQPVTQFLDELASSAATPGGGSGAAIMGALGAVENPVGKLYIIKKRRVESSKNN